MRFCSSRRLSTLVEEGSDAEAEESIHNPSPPFTHRAASSSASTFPFPASAASQIRPPQYKAPPAYKEALLDRRDHSPESRSARLESHAHTVCMVSIKFHYLPVPRQDGSTLVVCVSASHVIGRVFASRPGHTKDKKNGTNCLPAWHVCVRVGVWQCSPTV